MSPTKKGHSTKKHIKARKWIIAVTLLLAISILATTTLLSYFPKTTNSLNNEPEGFKTLANHYFQIMQNLNSTRTKATMATQLTPKYNQTDLFAWEQTKLTFTNDPLGWFEDPTQILQSGKGICVQWSIVYVSACLTLGYQSRLIVAVDTSNWSFIHTWAEDYYNGTWVHVDPSDKVWNSPSRYLNWDWGKGISSTVKIYAFEDNEFEDVTSSYS
jgi:hypothetical protein